MSLINDALKRAGQTEPTPPPVPERSMQPVETPPRSRWPFFIFPFLLFAVFGLGVWFLAKGFEIARQLTQEEPRVAARETASTSGTQNPTSQEQQQSNLAQQNPSPAQQVTSGAAHAPADQPDASVQELPTDVLASLKLQAVFYRTHNASAVISSKSVSVGDQVRGATVKEIRRDGVVVEWKGQKREFILP